jgi:hypothetical protein
MTQPDTAWLLFLTSLSGGSASTPRVRLWRALKGLGVAILRDGVAVLPASAAHRAALEVIAAQVEADGGTYWLLELPAQGHLVEDQLRASLDRSDAYRELRAGLAALRSELTGLDEAGVRRRLRQSERDLDAIVRTDFFPGDAVEQSREDLRQLVELINRRFSPQEPAAASGAIERLETHRFRGRLWATRRRLWVDRVVSAWLIRRFVDPEARFLWLDRPEDCPAEALGFDFDGAAFTHTRIQGGELVTFEVLAASFGLADDASLTRLGQLVHYLDAGGTPVAEAPGFEAVLAGLREGAADDDALLMATTPVLDALYLTYSGPRA